MNRRWLILLLAWVAGTTLGTAAEPVQASVTPAAIARGLINYIESQGPENAGRFYSYTDQKMPWKAMF